MSTTPVRPSGRTAPTAPSREDHHRFAHRVKQWSLGLAFAGFGLAWALVSRNVVGVTNASSTTPQATPGATPHRAAIPTSDFFGQSGGQPQPFIGNGGTRQVGAPVVRGGTS